MYDPTTTLLGRSFSTYTVLLMTGTLLSIGWMLLRAKPGTRTATLDACLSALVVAVITGRAGHVLLHWAYFRDHTDEITRLYFQGGLSVHGAMLGALAGLLLAVRWRKLSLSHLLASAALAVPLLGLAAWWGCAAAACAYGAPVEQMTDYPPLLTWIEPDIFGIVEPRFAAQRMGILFAVILLIVTALLSLRDWLPGSRLWIAVFLLCLGNGCIGILWLHDATLPEVRRAEAVLYILVMLVCAIILVRNAARQTRN